MTCICALLVLISVVALSPPALAQDKVGVRFPTSRDASVQAHAQAFRGQR